MYSFSGACGEQTYFRGGYPVVNHTLDERLKAYPLSKVQINLGEPDCEGSVVNPGVAYPTRLETMALTSYCLSTMTKAKCCDQRLALSAECLPCSRAVVRVRTTAHCLLPKSFVPQANLAGTSGHKAVATYTATDAPLPGQQRQCSTPPLKRLHLPGNRFALP